MLKQCHQSYAKYKYTYVKKRRVYAGVIERDVTSTVPLNAPVNVCRQAGITETIQKDVELASIIRRNLAIIIDQFFSLVFVNRVIYTTIFLENSDKTADNTEQQRS